MGSMSGKLILIKLCIKTKKAPQMRGLSYFYPHKRGDEQKT